MTMKSPNRWASGLAAMLLAILGGNAWATTQTLGYDYDANGFLVKEIVEQGDSGACVAKVYTPDIYGRRKEVHLRNCNASGPTLAGAPTEAAAPPAGSDALFVDRDSTVNFQNPDNGADTDLRFPQQITNVLSQTYRLKFDRRFGSTAYRADANGVAVQFAYDSLGRRIHELRADGNGVHVDYFFCSGFNGGTTGCPANAVWTERDTPVGGSALTLDANGVATVTTAGTQNGPISYVYFDAQGRVVRSQTQGFDGTQVYVDHTLTRAASGETAKISKPYYSGASAVWTTTVRDFLGRVVEVDAPVNTGGTATARNAYSGLSVTTTSPDPNNDGATVSSTTTRNRLGLVASVTDARGKTLTHAYDAFGNRVQTIDVEGNVNSTVYDTHGYGLPAQTYDPDLGVWSFTYDVLGDVRSRIDARASKSTFGYDGLGRLISRGEPDLSSTWTFDTCVNGKGALCEEQASDGFDRKFGYDSVGRAASLNVTMPGGVVYSGGVTFNADGRVDKMTYPGSGVVVQNGYVATLGYLQTITDVTPGVSSPPVYWTGEKFDAAGHPTQYTYGNKVRTVTSYFDDGHVNTSSAGELVNGVSANEVMNLQLGYHLAGTLSTRVDGDAPGSGSVVSNYSYDALARLTGETRSGGGLSGTQAIAWTYDDIGNIASRTDSALQNGYNNVYNYNGSGAGSQLPHAVMSVSGFVDNVAVPRYTYDADGNMLSGAGRTMAWTTFNNLQSVTKGSTTLALLYDTDHQRASETETINGAVTRTTHYVNPPAGRGQFFERDTGTAGKVERSFIMAGRQVVAIRVNNAGAWSTLYLHQDSLGSNVVVTNDIGQVAERLAYDPFGARRYANGVSDLAGTLVAQSTARGFTGHEHMDEVGLVNMNGRIFDGALGRFLSADTVGSIYDTQGQNRYSYALNSPTRFIDPSGHDPEDLQTVTITAPWQTYGTPLTDEQLGNTNFDYSSTLTSTIIGAYSPYRTTSTSSGGTLSIDDHWHALYSFLLPPGGQASTPGFDDPRFSYDNPAYGGVVTPPAEQNSHAKAHLILGTASLVPVIGDFATIADAGLSAWEGDWTGFGLSMAGLIPLGGEAAVAAKLAREGKMAEKVLADAKTLAADARAAGSDAKAGSVMMTKDGKTYSALSGEEIPVMHDDMLGYLMGAGGKERSVYHGGCSEVACLNKALLDNADLDGAVISTVNVASEFRLTGTIKPACDSCNPMLRFFGVTPVK